MRKKATEKEDVFIGGKLRLRRSQLGLSQHSLGKFEKLTFQQIQKYEKGMNRIGAGRLYRFARILHVPIAYFYDGLDEASALDGKDEKLIEFDKRLGNDLKKLNAAFLKIKNKRLRNGIVRLTIDFIKIDKNCRDD